MCVKIAVSALNCVRSGPVSEVHYLSSRIRSKGITLIGGGARARSLAGVSTMRRNE